MFGVKCQDMLTKIGNIVKYFWDLIRANFDGIFVACLLVLCSIISFNLGRISALEKTPLKFETDANIFNAVENSKNKAVNSPDVSTSINKIQTDPRVVVSKNSDKYHFSWCSGAKRIKEENKIWFNSTQEAERAGYTLAANCQ